MRLGLLVAALGQRRVDGVALEALLDIGFGLAVAGEIERDAVRELNLFRGRLLAHGTG